MDPYDWLPGYGESRLECYTAGVQLHVLVCYDDLTGGKSLLKRILTFLKVSTFEYGSAYGPRKSIIEYEIDRSTGVRDGQLIEFEKSDVAAAWTKFHNGTRFTKHFEIYFAGEEKYLRVFAESWSLSPPEPVGQELT